MNDPQRPQLAPLEERDLAPSSGATPSLGSLFGQLAQDSSTLIKQEIGLAKAEMRASMRETATGAVRVGIAAAVAGVGAHVLVAFLVLLLGQLLDNYWLAALIVGGVLTLLGGILALSGMRRLKEVSVAPEATMETLKEDGAWARGEIQQVKRGLRG